MISLNIMWKQLDKYGTIKTTKIRLGFKILEEKYIKAIKAFLTGKDAFPSLPTGYGIVLCSQSLMKSPNIW